MATVTGLTAARMTTMENATIIDGNVVGNDLVLVTKGGTNINAGNVRGPIGPAGATFIVCTSITRPSLSAGEEGKAIYETDTDLIRIWTGTRWKAQERIICTSTSRPAGLGTADEGVKIYETDTNLEYIWTGTAWLPVNVGPPPGTCYPYIGPTEPLNHVFMYGQSIPNAQTSYPALWANVDATWKAGTSLRVPDLRCRVVAGKDNMGGVVSGRFSAEGTGFHGVNGSVLGSAGGNEWMQSHHHGTGTTIFGLYAGFVDVAPGTYSILTQTTDTGLGNAQNVQPTIILNWILKLL